MALVEYELEDGVALLTLNDPPVNGYSYDMMRELDARVLDARMDEQAQVIVITGNGQKFFCAGADIKMLQKATPSFKYYFCLHANETLNRLEHTPKLTIAAINGHCVGGGLEVAMACDLRVARVGGGKLGLPEVALGVLPGTGGTQRLARMVGKSKAIELMVEGATFPMQRGLELGIVNKCWDAADHAQFMTQALDYARSFCHPAKASRAVGNIKRAVQSGLEMSFEQGLALERELQAGLFGSDDAREGLRAYTEKRAASFTGK
jgi:enoyl-CoA hydratase/carnithine racemase